MLSVRAQPPQHTAITIVRLTADLLSSVLEALLTAG